MKKLIIGCCLLALMASCEGGKKKVDPFAALTEQIDSMKVLPDSIQDTIVVEEQIPASADESFADFFYNFASDAKFQRSRVLFPFSLYKGKQVNRIQKKDWKHDPLFSREQAYTVLFDKEEDMEMEKDTSMHSVQVDWIFLTEKKSSVIILNGKKILGSSRPLMWRKWQRNTMVKKISILFMNVFHVIRFSRRNVCMNLCIL